MFGDLVDFVAIHGLRNLAGRDGEIAVLEVRRHEVLTIAHRMPGEEILLAIRSRRQQFEEQDGFVEVI